MLSARPESPIYDPCERAWPGRGSFFDLLRTYRVAPSFLDDAGFQARTIAVYLAASFLDAPWMVRRQRRALVQYLGARTGASPVLGHTILVNRAFSAGDDADLRAVQAHEAAHHAWERSRQEPGHADAWPVADVECVLRPRLEALATALRLSRYPRAALAEEIVAHTLEQGWRTHHSGTGVPPRFSEALGVLEPILGVETAESFYRYVDNLPPARDLE